MTLKKLWRMTAASLALTAMMGPVAASAAEKPLVEIGPKSSDTVGQYVHDDATVLTNAQKIALLQKKVKYVFVLFQENRSFDHYFGTFPGVNGLFSQPAAQTPGFYQKIVSPTGVVNTISPFKIPQSVKNTTSNTTITLYPEDTDSVDHSHTGIDISMDFNANYIAANDRYALNEEKLTTNGNGQIVSQATGSTTFANPTLTQEQKGELVMGHLDCDTIPFLWQYADRFTMFDNFRATVTGPSTPNAIAMIAGQTGVTQWALHPGESSANIGDTTLANSGGEPVTADFGPFPGSNLDLSPVKPPYNAGDENPAKPALNQTYASLPLSFMGKQINKTIKFDQNPALDLLDVQSDIATIASTDKAVNWRWYQQGYDHEPTDGSGPASHVNYIVHHEGPQYFGYIADNTEEQANLRGLGDFFTDMSNQNFPKTGGVFYVRGGYGNNDGLTPRAPSPTVKANFTGNDDHPAYSDAQISEALLADEVNAIANSPYWKDSAIIITYDETDGLYDHVQPDIRQLDPSGAPLAGGPRIPAIVISPYAVAHGIVHEESEHGSVIKFINELFKLTPLADLPDEQNAKALGQTETGQSNLEPSDGSDNALGDLTAAFDNDRLAGKAPVLPASYAIIPTADVQSLPHYGGQGCYVLNIVPTDYQNGVLIDPAPADFNPRPSTNPGTPETDATWPTN